MDQTYPVGPVIGIAIMVGVALLLPYLGPNRRDLIATTSIYRPISLLMLLAHCVLTLMTAQAFLPYSPLPPLTICWAFIFTGLEIRSARTGQPVKRNIILALLALSASIILGFVFLNDIALRLRGITHAVLLTALVIWLVYEAFLTWRANRNVHYAVVFGALTIGLIAMLVRDYYFLQETRMAMATIVSETRGVLRARFFAYGFLCFSLLALNHAYGAQLWRATLFRRQSRELMLVSALRDVAQVRDNETGNHIMRTRQFVRILARRLAEKRMLDDDGIPNFVNMLARAAPLHDVGKVSIPDNILLKPGRLSDQEMRIMRTHASIGAEILRSAADAQEGNRAASDLLLIGAQIAGQHHENWDGSGYPLGLSGTQIAQPARIMALADVYDALTSARPYKTPWSHEDAVAHILSLQGTKFDPDIVDTFVEEAETFQAVAIRLRDS